MVPAAIQTLPARNKRRLGVAVGLYLFVIIICMYLQAWVHRQGPGKKLNSQKAMPPAAR